MHMSISKDVSRVLQLNFLGIALFLKGSPAVPQTINIANSDVQEALIAKWGPAIAPLNVQRFFQLCLRFPNNAALRLRLAKEYAPFAPAAARFNELVAAYLEENKADFRFDELYSGLGQPSFCRLMFRSAGLFPTKESEAETVRVQVLRELSQDPSSWRELEKTLEEAFAHFGADCHVFLSLAHVWATGWVFKGSDFPTAKQEAAVRLTLELAGAVRDEQAEFERAWRLFFLGNGVLSMHGDHIGGYVALVLAQDALRTTQSKSRSKAPQSLSDSIQKGVKVLKRLAEKQKKE